MLVACFLVSSVAASAAAVALVALHKCALVKGGSAQDRHQQHWIIIMVLHPQHDQSSSVFFLNVVVGSASVSS